MQYRKNFPSKILGIFHDKPQLYGHTAAELVPQFIWEIEKWPILTREVPVKESDEVKLARKRRGGPETLFFKVRPKSPNKKRHAGCVGSAFRAEQLEKLFRIVYSATTPEEFLQRIAKEIEVP
jgi:hypothetical protein